MKMVMKHLDYGLLVKLNESSMRQGHNQQIPPELMPVDTNKRYIINFHFDHDWAKGKDVRCSVILKPGILTAWLDVSMEEYATIPDIELSELDWEAAVCVGVPRWVA